MKSETTIVATQYRLQQWATQIQECQNRPEDMSVKEWCDLSGITTANYYYRLRCVRKACLEAIPKQVNTQIQEVVPVNTSLLHEDTSNTDKKEEKTASLNIIFGDFRIQVTESTPIWLLSEVIGVIKNAK